jgi:hypothetical protein
MDFGVIIHALLIALKLRVKDLVKKNQESVSNVKEILTAISVMVVLVDSGDQIVIKNALIAKQM